jgi:hypothetical protein
MSVIPHQEMGVLIGNFSLDGPATPLTVEASAARPVAGNPSKLRVYKSWAASHFRRCSFITHDLSIPFSALSLDHPHCPARLGLTSMRRYHPRCSLKDTTAGPPHLTNKSRISNAGAISGLQATGVPT